MQQIIYYRHTFNHHQISSSHDSDTIQRQWRVQSASSLFHRLVIALQKFFSMVSLWEIDIKRNIGKLAISQPIELLLPPLRIIATARQF